MTTERNTSTTVDVDYPREVLVDASRFRHEIAVLRTPSAGPPKTRYSRGVSVIIPSHNGRDRILSCLESLSGQSISKDLFEAIVVLNGEPDGTRDLIERSEVASSLHMRVFETDQASAGEARNIGISAARHEYLTFLDDDDAIERDFLLTLYGAAEPDTIIIAPLGDVSEEGRATSSTLGDRLQKLQGRGLLELRSEPWLLGFNACKLIPTRIASTMNYDANLRSGEDLVFMAGLLATDGIKALAPEPRGPSRYLRTLREDSVSRQSESFDFSVLQRLAVMKRLERIAVTPEDKLAIDSLKTAQAGFVSRYLAAHPETEQEIRSAIDRSGLHGFPWAVLNKGRARQLVIAYCFSPFMDTSAVVASKIVADRGEYVDVISNDMSSIRNVDDAVSTISDRWIDSRTQIQVQPAFSDWPLITEFAEQALEAALAQARSKGGYEHVYSRALWVGSHVAAARFKLRSWSTEWSAEFSDPLRHGVDGGRRKGAIVDNETARLLERTLTDRGFKRERVETLFDLVELSTFALADHLIFTNENQRDSMLDGIASDRLRDEALAKTVVRRHPEPPRHAYSAVETSYRLPDGPINIGYFGAFYRNRSIDEVLVAIANLHVEEQRSIRLHVFSNSPEAVSTAAAAVGVSPLVYSNKYLSYMEFLSVTTKFDYLLVNDVNLGVGHVNPFLPSKLSDYRGSGSKIWALVDPGSPLSREHVDYSSPVGDSHSAMSVLRDMVRVKRPRS